MKNLTDIRQLFYPREFRIRRPAFDLMVKFKSVSVNEPRGSDGRTENTDGLDSKKQAKLVAELGTELWRLRRRMTDEDTGEPRDELRKTFRPVAAAWETLSDFGVEIQDHTGQPFRSGLAIEALAFQPTTGLTKEIIIETVRPSIYFGGRQVQRGQVIVGIPEEKR